jgi:hypothetical protein
MNHSPNSPQLGNGATAAIWSCREDVVAIVVGQAIFIRPIFTRCFWSHGLVVPNSAAIAAKKLIPGTRTEAVPLAPTRTHLDKRKKDPFSLSAALESHGSLETDGDKTTLDGEGGSISSGRTGGRSFREQPPPLPRKDSRRDTLVISVSQRVEVQTVESPSRGREEGLAGGDYLAATNTAECYNDGREEGGRERKGSRGGV